MMKTKDSKRSEAMRRHIEMCEAGIISVSAYCKQNRIAPSNYYYWKNKLGVNEQASSSFIELVTPGAVAGIQISYPNGVQLHLPKDVSLSFITGLVCCI